MTDNTPWWDRTSEENVRRLQAPPVGVQMAYCMMEHPQPFLSCDLRFNYSLSESLRRERQRSWAARTIKKLRSELHHTRAMADLLAYDD